MDITIYPGKLSGSITAIPSKSQAHRLLICAAFADRDTMIICPSTNADIEATADCLRSLGATICRTYNGYQVSPVSDIPKSATLDCGESGSTLRFMLPVVGALGVDTTFLLSGRLPERPLSPLWEEMERKGCYLSRPTERTLRCNGQLRGGSFSIDGSVSSQFITGLLFAAALLPERTKIDITGSIESRPYIQMTLDALSAFGVNCWDFEIESHFPFRSPAELQVEGDWSNAAFFLAANALGSDIEINNLNMSSSQGDKAILSALNQFSSNCTIACQDIPDLVPIMAVTAAAMHGATFTGISRLRLKESDRVNTVSNMLMALGIEVASDEHSMTVKSGQFRGCTIDAAGDHRIAMSAAIAATCATGPVTILGAECVSKSYPSFWDAYRKLGGQYEQYLR